MPRKTKIVTLRDATYSIHHMDAVTGSTILQNMQEAICAYTVGFENSVLEFKWNKRKRQIMLAGWFIHFGKLIEAITAPLYAKGAPKLSDDEYASAESELIETTINSFLEGVTVAGEQVNMCEHFEGKHDVLASLLVYVFIHNFLAVYTKKRFETPENYDSGVTKPLSVERQEVTYSQSALVYTVLQAKAASYYELQTFFNTEEIYNLYENVCRECFEQNEYQKQAQKEAEQKR